MCYLNSNGSTVLFICCRTTRVSEKPTVVGIRKKSDTASGVSVNIVSGGGLEGDDKNEEWVEEEDPPLHHHYHSALSSRSASIVNSAVMQVELNYLHILMIIIFLLICKFSILSWNDVINFTVKFLILCMLF